uniref:Uncharacterized protein n=1 Tax=Anguilla anguilla TaxID=7936 RepID=A0A0E9XZ54_ANGAN
MKEDWVYTQAASEHRPNSTLRQISKS